MNPFSELTRFLTPPEPWVEGEKIPWNDPAFSERMLAEHLSQAHDWASRRASLIERHVAWIDVQIPPAPARVLDLGCGPGLYASRLASAGYEVTGLDFSPASIRYAQEHAGKREAYRLGDLRREVFGTGYAAALFLFGEFNVFRPEEARALLAKTYAALNPGGVLILEAQTSESVRRQGCGPSTWRLLPRGLFSDTPHLYLEQHAFDMSQQAATTRYVIVDINTATYTAYAATSRLYTDDDYRRLLQEAGFADIRFFASLTGEAEGAMPDFYVWLARKP